MDKYGDPKRKREDLNGWKVIWLVIIETKEDREDSDGVVIANHVFHIYFHEKHIFLGKVVRVGIISI